MIKALPKNVPWRKIMRSYLNDTPVDKPMFDVAEFLSRTLIADLATCFEDRPHVAPVWFNVMERAVWVTTLSASKKVRNIARNPNVALCIDTAGPKGSKYVIIEGKAEILAEADRELHLRIFRKYMGEEGAKSKEVDDWFKAGVTLVKVTPVKVITRATS